MPTPPIQTIREAIADMLNVKLDPSHPDFNVAAVDKVNEVAVAIEQKIADMLPPWVTDKDVETIIASYLSKHPIPTVGPIIRYVIPITLTVIVAALGYLGVMLSKQVDALTASLAETNTKIANLQTSTTTAVDGINAQIASLGGFELQRETGKFVWMPSIDYVSTEGLNNRLSAYPFPANVDYAVDYILQLDLDSDGLAGTDDDCPDIKGVEANHGCPAFVDKDSDSVDDWYDACLTTPTEEVAKVIDSFSMNAVIWTKDLKAIPWQGCTDADKDSVADNVDACPNATGTPEYLGCAEMVDTCGHAVSSTATRAVYDQCAGAPTMQTQVDCAYTTAPDGTYTYSDCKTVQ